MQIPSDVIKINCTYQYEGLVKEGYNWEGYAIITYRQDLSKDFAVSDIEALILDQSDTQRNQEIHKRYLLGIGGVDFGLESISFSIFPGNICPFDYRVKYDSEDNCFYGLWYYVNKNNFTSEFGGYAKIEAIENYNIDKSSIQSEILKWSNDKYYGQYFQAITHITDNQKSNIAEYNENLEEISALAKEYFHSISKTKIKK